MSSDERRNSPKGPDAFELLADAREELELQRADLVAAQLVFEAQRWDYFDMFEAAPYAQFVTDELAIVREANRATCELLQVERKFLIGKPISVYLHPASTQLLRQLFVGVQGGVSQGVELTIQPRNAPARRVKLTCAAVAGGTKLFFTAQLAGGEDAARAAESRQLTQELEVERRARRDLEADAMARDQSMTVLSHELLEPLNVVLGWNRIMSEGEMSAAMRAKAHEVIDRNVRAQLALVNRVVDVSRVVSGTLQLDEEEVDLTALLGFGVETMATASQAKGVVIHSNIASDLIVRGDEVRLSQIVASLLGNALKFTPRGGVIDVLAHAVRSDIIVEVRDTGIGIHAEELPRLFTCFHQAPTAQIHRGVGIGLFLARALARLHGGGLTASSAGVGQGAAFVLKLPRQLGAGAPDKVSIH